MDLRVCIHKGLIRTPFLLCQRKIRWTYVFAYIKFSLEYRFCRVNGKLDGLEKFASPKKISFHHDMALPSIVMCIV